MRIPDVLSTTDLAAASRDIGDAELLSDLSPPPPRESAPELQAVIEERHSSAAAPATARLE
ncbi:hypothetical protein GCM10025872_32580 [Barrientosiimonas endolithica]|uniref:Uncharacterized protein n=1 Tax=Barrientosiimonas endolithica TaxID=1535208 RepID=A0ABN6YR39_9MICO|nr:hypothetical protein GCM10025872_32580 [Barrientosiimonas endolithica]